MLAGDFNTLFDLLPIGAYLSTPEGVQLRANQALVKLNGFDTEQELLDAVNDIAGQWYVSPTRRAEFREQLEAAGELHDFVSEIWRYKTRERIWISENAHVVRDEAGRPLYYEGTVEDITARKRAAESLEAASALLREKSDALQVTLDNMSQGIMRLDAQGRIVFHSKRVAELLDLPESLLASQPTLQELARYQGERGDFGENKELLGSSEIRASHGRLVESNEIRRTAGSYVRKTRSGLVLEIKSQPLADGGMVRTYSDVTDYYHAQEELERKTQTLQITLDNMDQGIATIDASGRTTTSNKRHHQLLDFPEWLMANQPTMEELVRFQVERGDFGTDFSFVDAVARGYVAVGGTTDPHQAPETYLRRTREGKMLEVKTRPLPDGGVVRTFSDVTAYFAAQEALSQKQAQLTALVHTIPDRVWLKDADGVYLLSNPAHRRQHGLAEEDIVGRTAQELFGREAGDEYRASDLRAMEADKPTVYEDTLLDPVDGSLQYYELVKVPMRDETGRCIGLLGLARNITARKETEAALIAARDAAEAATRAKAEFLANMSHEIRTPMNAVIGMSDLLMDTPLNAMQREFAETVRTSSEALLVLINDILDFSKIDSGHLDLEHAPVNLAECVESALDLTSGPALAKGLDLLYWIEDDVPRAILGDVTRLRQVFINLVNNAIKFTSQGEVLVTLSRRAGADGVPLLHGSVRDSGIGIPADSQDRLFQVFSQVDTSTTRKYGGTGLGLAICKRLVTLMGGRIWVDSEPGKGSDFQFEIPYQAAPSGPSAYVSKKAPSLAGRRLLLVDDNATNRHILALQTRRWGMLPHEAASGEDALALLDAGEAFDAAVIDVQMPGMDGYQLAAELRRRRTRAQLPLLVLTSLGDAGSRLDGLDVARTLMKPTKSSVLFEALCALFDPASQPGAAGAAARSGPKLAQSLPLHLLVAEDNAINQRVATLILSGLGYQITMVEDGAQAVAAVAQAQAAGEPFDVVLMDVQMPGMDGLEASRALCAAWPTATARPWILAMTANAMEGDREACLAAGMDDYVRKPIRAVDLAQALQRAGAGLARRRATQGE